MTDQIDDPDENDNSETKPGSAKGLRAALDAANAAKLALETENATLKKTVRQTTVAEALKTHGAKPSLAKFYDKDEASTDDVLTWLRENGEDFGWTEGDGADDDDAETVNQAGRIRTLADGAPQKVVAPQVTPDMLKTADYATLRAAGLVL